MKSVGFSLFAASILALASAAPAIAAEQLHYSLSGAYSAEWDLLLMPVPDQSDAGSFTIQTVFGTFPGADQPVTLTFYVSGNPFPFDGGFSIVDSSSNGRLLPGDQLFTGSTGAPTMRTGTFSLDAVVIDSEGHILLVPDAYQLIASVVPEPATWAMLVAGFGLAGMALRQRARPARVSFALARA